MDTEHPTEPLRGLLPPSRFRDAAARARDALRFSPREAIALAVLAVLLVGGAGLALVRGRPVPAEPLRPVEPVAASAGPSAEARLVVHVVGAVRRPGVYTFAAGARVVDAVREAGGLTRRADHAAVNLARPLSDGEQVIVPRRGEAPPQASGSGSSGGGGAGAGGRVNINRATATELDALPGIGPVLAERIVAYREQHGPFRTVRDLLKVSGIGPAKFETLEPHVTV